MPITACGGCVRDIFVSNQDIIDRFVEKNLFIWGRNHCGQLGINNVANRSSPVQTVSSGTDWQRVNLGFQHSGGIKLDGTLWMWGRGSEGRLGNGSSAAGAARSSPVQTVTGGTDWKQVVLGGDHSAAIKCNGSFWTWGRNNVGQTGGGGYTQPGQVFASGIRTASLGFAFTGVINTGNCLLMTGSNASGQLGDGSITNRSAFAQTVGGTDWSSLGLGGDHSAAVKTDGTLWLWGLGTSGQLGNQSIISRSSPVQTISGGSNWRQVSSGRTHTAAIKTDGSLWTWGLGTGGLLGDNTAVAKSSPVQTVSGGTNWREVSSNRDTTMAIKTDGTLWLWGLNAYGQIGNDVATGRSSPVQTVSGGTNWRALSSGSYHSAALCSN